jgi:hypothetical protein
MRKRQLAHAASLSIGSGAAVSAPDWIESDPRHPDRIRSYKAIAEHGGRVLRVVHRPEGDDILIITVHFDRGAGDD